MRAMDEVIPLSARHGQVPTVAMVLTDGVSHDKRANVVDIAPEAWCVRNNCLIGSNADPVEITVPA